MTDQTSWRDEPLGRRWPDMAFFDEQVKRSGLAAGLGAIVFAIRSNPAGKGRAEIDTRINTVLQDEITDLRVRHDQLADVIAVTEDQLRYQQEHERFGDQGYPVSEDALRESMDRMTADNEQSWNDGRDEFADTVSDLVLLDQRIMPSTVEQIAQDLDDDGRVSERLRRNCGIDVDRLRQMSEQTPGYVGAERREQVRSDAKSGVDFSRVGQVKDWHLSPDLDLSQRGFIRETSRAKQVDLDMEVSRDRVERSDPERVGEIAERVVDKIKRERKSKSTPTSDPSIEME